MQSDNNSIMMVDAGDTPASHTQTDQSNNFDMNESSATLPSGDDIDMGISPNIIPLPLPTLPVPTSKPQIRTTDVPDNIAEYDITEAKLADMIQHLQEYEKIREEDEKIRKAQEQKNKATAADIYAARMKGIENQIHYEFLDDDYPSTSYQPSAVNLTKQYMTKHGNYYYHNGKYYPVNSNVTKSTPAYTVKYEEEATLTDIYDIVKDSSDKIESIHLFTNGSDTMMSDIYDQIIENKDEISEVGNHTRSINMRMYRAEQMIALIETQQREMRAKSEEMLKIMYEMRDKMNNLGK